MLSQTSGWKAWKQGFDVWEKATAEYLDTVLRSPLILGPSGKMLGTTMKVVARTNDSLAKWWGRVGLSTKRDQERTLHALNQIQSRLMDIEERLEAIDR